MISWSFNGGSTLDGVLYVVLSGGSGSKTEVFGSSCISVSPSSIKLGLGSVKELEPAAFTVFVPPKSSLESIDCLALDVESLVLVELLFPFSFFFSCPSSSTSSSSSFVAVFNANAVLLDKSFS